MPRYFFDITDSRRVGGAAARDRSGLDLDDEAAARTHALMVLGGFILPAATAANGESRVACRDEAGAVLFVASFKERPEG